MSNSTSSTLIISVSGGIVTEMLSRGPLQAALLDYDTDGDDDDTVSVPQPHGRDLQARLREHDNEDAPARVAAIEAVLPPFEGEAESTKDTIRAVVVMSGGVVQNVLTEHPLRVIIVDYDIEEAEEVEEADLVAIPQKRGAPESALADDLDPEVNPREVASLYALWTPQAEPVPPAPAPATRRPRRR